LANGRDEREVIPERETKSLGAEETYAEDIFGKEIVSRELLALAVKVGSRLRRAGLSGHTLTVKLRNSAFKTITRSKTVEEPLVDHLAIYALAQSLVPKGAWGPYRLLGLQVSSLRTEKEDTIAAPRLIPLFGPAQAEVPRCDPRLTSAMDLINQRFGSRGVTPATLLEKVFQTKNGGPGKVNPG
jgi:DNA polymerase-4